MNVFDFDGTIYDGDSSVDFVLFCARRHPALVRFAPSSVVAAIRYKVGRITKTQMKQRFFAFLRGIGDWETEVMAFWDAHEDRIFAWYREVGGPDDLVISASPEFLLGPICARLGLRFPIASRVDPETGLFAGENCRDVEKVRRFREAFGDEKIENFYSDSAADTPLAALAETAWLISDGRPTPWPT